MSVGVNTDAKCNHSEIDVEVTAELNRIIWNKISSFKGNGNTISDLERRQNSLSVTKNLISGSVEASRFRETLY
jgi:hypothetical protein